MGKSSPSALQQDAIEHNEGPCMVLAGPGSGKTTVITYRVKHLIENLKVDPLSILVVTFTKSAAVEMEMRCNRLFGAKSGATFGTFHSIFFNIIRRHRRERLDILDEGRRFAIIKQLTSKVFKETDEELFKLVSSEISICKNEMYDLAHYNSVNISSEEFKNIFSSYEALKKDNNFLDFDDMLTVCYELLQSNDILELWQNRFRYILIDEFQDINRIQYECMKLLAKRDRNIFVVGDDDQSIYKFRGAKPDILLKFPKDFEGTRKIVLDTNYRSTENIIRFCNRVIAVNSKRYHKEIKGVDREGPNPQIVISQDVYKEALDVAARILELKPDNLKTVAVIYRTNIQAIAFIEAFTSMGIPYRLRDEPPSIFDHFSYGDICAYLNLSKDPDDRVLLARIMNKPSRYIPKGALDVFRKDSKNILATLTTSKSLNLKQRENIYELKLHLSVLQSKNTYEAIKYIRKLIGYNSYIKSYCAYHKIEPDNINAILDEITESSKPYPTFDGYMEHVRQTVEENKKAGSRMDINGVTLSTIHSAKGLEFETVFVVGAVDGVIPHGKSHSVSELEEERRLFYVGLTRAKSRLFVYATETRYDAPTSLTPFLKPFLKGKGEKV